MARPLFLLSFYASLQMDPIPAPTEINRLLIRRKPGSQPNLQRISKKKKNCPAHIRCGLLFAQIVFGLVNVTKIEMKNKIRNCDRTHKIAIESKLINGVIDRLSYIVVVVVVVTVAGPFLLTI